MDSDGFYSRAVHEINSYFNDMLLQTMSVSVMVHVVD